MGYLELVLPSKMTVFLQLICFLDVTLRSPKTVVSRQVLLQKVLTHHGESRIMKQDDRKGDAQGEHFLKITSSSEAREGNENRTQIIRSTMEIRRPGKQKFDQLSVGFYND